MLHDRGGEETHPGLDLIASGTVVLVGVVTVQGKGDFGVPGVFGVGVECVGDMGLEPISCPASIDPAVLAPPSLLPDFYQNKRFEDHNAICHSKPKTKFALVQPHHENVL